MCKARKPLNDFGSNKSKIDKKAAECKLCAAARTKAYKKANADKVREKDKIYREANKDKIKHYRDSMSKEKKEERAYKAKKARQADKENFNAKQRAKYAKDPEKYRKLAKKWIANNPNKAKEIAKQSRERNNTPEKLAIRAERCKKWIKNNPEKRKVACDKYKSSEAYIKKIIPVDNPTDEILYMYKAHLILQRELRRINNGNSKAVS